MMRFTLPLTAAIAAATFGAALPAHAYIGPGAGLGAIAVTIAIVLGVVLLLVGFLWYPLKRMLRGRKTAGDKPGVEPKS